jgi:outer membrane autotransporter barrel domain
MAMFGESRQLRRRGRGQQSVPVSSGRGLRRVRASLLSGTALTALAALGLVSQVSVDEARAECGPAGANINCTDPAYNSGISYKRNNDTNLIVSNPNGTTILNRGVSLEQTRLTPRNFNVLIENDASTITTTRNDRPGIEIKNGGNITINNAATIQTGGNNSQGINAVSRAGFLDFSSKDVTVISTGNITTTGNNSTGINAERSLSLLFGSTAGIGNVKVEAEDVTAEKSRGINATTGFGSVNVTANEVNAGTTGVNATTALGLAAVSVGNVHASGLGINAEVKSGVVGNIIDVLDDANVLDDVADALGISESILESLGDGIGIAYVNAGNVTSTGAGGINARTGFGAAIVLAGNVNSAGIGINARAGTGLAFAFANNVDTAEEAINAHGINVEAGGIAAAVSTGKITTKGDGAYGVRVVASEMGDFGVLSDFIDGLAGSGGFGGLIDDNFDPVFDGLSGESASGFVNSASTALSAISNGVALAIVNDVSTSGDGARGVSAEAGEGFAGVLAGNVVTTGEGSTGIYGQGSSVYIVAGNVETHGDNSAGIRNDANGTSVTLFGFVNTFGDNSPGVDASDPASDVFVAGLGVTTGGVGSNGINATSGFGNVDVYVGFVGTGGDNSRGIHAFSQSGDVGVTAGIVGTLGDNSDGIRAVSLNGDVDVDVLTVGTAGDNSDAIRVFSRSGDVEVNALAVGTLGEDSDGIRAISLTGNININALAVGTVGDGSDGIRAYSRNGDIRVTAGMVGALGDGSHGIHARSTNGSVDILVNDVVLGGGGMGGAGVVFGGGNTANLLNQGFIGALNGRAIVNDGNDSHVENNGIVAGYVEMGDGDDVFDNAAGARFVAYGDSDFGDGDFDRFNNAGRVTMLPWRVTDTVTIAGLETFDNSLGGEIWLRNSFAGDALRLPDSNFISGGTFAIDAELRASGKADELHIGRNISGGVTSLFVNDVDPGAPGAFDPNGIPFAVVGGSTQPGDFSLVNGPFDKGLFTYDIFLRPGAGDSGENLWVLASTPDQTFFELPSITSAAQSLWYSSTGVWLDRTADLRSVSAACTAGGMKDEVVCGPAARRGVWAKAFGNWSERSQDHSFSLHGRTFDYKVEYDQDSYGIVGGFDFAPNVNAAYGRGGWLLGVMAGYINSTQDFKRSTTNVDMEGALVGAYATYLQDGLFVDAQIAANIGEVRYSSAAPGLAAKDSADLRSIGGIIDVGYRMPFGSASTFIEPGVTLAYVNSNIDNVTIFGTKVDFKDGDSLRGRLGVRLGTSMIAGNHKIEPFVGASAWYEFKGENEITAKSNGYELAAKDDVGGWIGEVSGGINLFDMSNAGVSGFAKGNYQFGDDDYRSFSGQLGIRVQW